MVKEKRVRQALQKSSSAQGWQWSGKTGKDTDEGMPQWKKRRAEGWQLTAGVKVQMPLHSTRRIQGYQRMAQPA